MRMRSWGLASLLVVGGCVGREGGAVKRDSPVREIAPPGVVTVSSAAHPGSPTAGIQEAVDALPPDGGVVLIGPGIYPVRHSIALRSNVTLRGEGPSTVLLRPAPVRFELTSPSPAGTMEATLRTVEGLRPGDELWITAPLQIGWFSRHLEIRTIANRKVTGVLVAGDPKRSYTPEAGAWGANFFPMIFIRECRNASVENMTIDGGNHLYDTNRPGDFTCSAVHGVGAQDLVVRHVTVRRWPGDGISAQGGTATVTGCLVEECLGNGYHPGSSIHAGIWTGNTARRNNWDGFYFCRDVRNLVVANNLFCDNRRHGIGDLTAPDAYNVITGNVIARNGRCGLDAPHALGNTITGNLFQDNSQSAPGAFAALSLVDHAGNVITGNNFVDTQKTPTQTVAIEAKAPAGTNLIERNLGAETVIVSAGMALPRGEVRRTPTSPNLDGLLDDAAWATADTLVVDRLVADGTQVEAPLHVRLLHDDRFLYAAVRCTEPYVDRIRDVFRKRGEDAWAENSVEFYIAPGAADGRVCQLAVNSLGALFEAQYVDQKFMAWDSRGQVVVGRGTDFWSAELAIPCEAFGADAFQPGREWKVNIGHSRHTVVPVEVTAWSTTYGAFLVPGRMGTLVVK